MLGDEGVPAPQVTDVLVVVRENGVVKWAEGSESWGTRSSAARRVD